ncbi:hypothetical protein ACLK17_25070 [Escherichia coli]
MAARIQQQQDIHNGTLPDLFRKHLRFRYGLEILVFPRTYKIVESR